MQTYIGLKKLEGYLQVIVQDEKPSSVVSSDAEFVLKIKDGIVVKTGRVITGSIAWYTPPETRFIALIHQNPLYKRNNEYAIMFHDTATLEEMLALAANSLSEVGDGIENDQEMVVVEYDVGVSSPENGYKTVNVWTLSLADDQRTPVVEETEVTVRKYMINPAMCCF